MSLRRTRNTLAGTRTDGKKEAVIDRCGYCHPYTPAKRGGWIDQHRAIAELVLERALLPKEEVHHINGDKKDNRPANLYVATSKSDHKLAHVSLEKVAYQLVKRGVITFREGRYEIPGLD